MPVTTYTVGDFVKHENLGKGIILNVFSQNGMPSYHIEFFSDTCRYITDKESAKMTTIRPSDEQTQKTVQDILLQYFNKSQYTNKTRYTTEPIPGDIVRHNGQKYLIIGPAPDSKMHIPDFEPDSVTETSRYHVYHPDTDSFAYIRARKFGWAILRKSNTAARKDVNKLWLDRILPQPYII